MSRINSRSKGLEKKEANIKETSIFGGKPEMARHGTGKAGKSGPEVFVSHTEVCFTA